MSRIGRLPIAIPAGVKVGYDNGVVTVTGPKGQLTQPIVSRHIDVKINGAEIEVTRNAESKETRAKHGLYRQLISNMIKGVVAPYVKTLIVNGVGWKCSVANGKLVMNVGLSHPVEFVAPQGITVACTDPVTITITGISKELVGQTAATIKSKRPIEPYHAYGIRYSDEVVVKKEGKTSGK